MNYRSDESLAEQKSFRESQNRKREGLIDEMLVWYMQEIKSEKDFKLYKPEFGFNRRKIRK